MAAPLGLPHEVKGLAVLGVHAAIHGAPGMEEMWMHLYALTR